MKTLIRFAVVGLLVGTASVAEAHHLRGAYESYDAYAPFTYQAETFSPVLRAPRGDSDAHDTATGGPAGGLPNGN